MFSSVWFTRNEYVGGRFWFESYSFVIKPTIQNRSLANNEHWYIEYFHGKCILVYTSLHLFILSPMISFLLNILFLHYTRRQSSKVSVYLTAYCSQKHGKLNASQLLPFASLFICSIVFIAFPLPPRTSTQQYQCEIYCIERIQRQNVSWIKQSCSFVDIPSPPILIAEKSQNADNNHWLGKKTVNFNEM